MSSNPILFVLLSVLYTLIFYSIIPVGLFLLFWFKIKNLTFWKVLFGALTIITIFSLIAFVYFISLLKGNYGGLMSMYIVLFFSTFIISLSLNIASYKKIKKLKVQSIIVANKI